jgi:hypothetical protein
MQMAFTPTNQDLQTIEQYRHVLEQTYKTNKEKIRVIDERLKTVNKKRLDIKTSRYTEQLRFILCDIEPLTCPLVIEQSL